ncbi:anti-sigma factor [Bacillus sp. DX4.1]|uniref:anti-sigma factor n=1 Tax=Bacillus sp. DX4.1 TaxID=3055867 RepID=UPI0025A14006|nr:anti-sigma factor [Bacillus sp. DX4.1]MDM5186781.1 anti-sigma factor [Bacillus sp. DX4.1]
MERNCNHLLSYITNELSVDDQKDFKDHLKNCPKCDKDYIQIKEAWEALQFDFEETEVPESLKSEVLDFVFAPQQKEPDSFVSNLKKWLTYFKQQFTPLATVLVLILLITTTIFTIANIQMSNQTLTGKELNSQPVEILSTLSLTSVDQNRLEANGHAFIVQQGDEKKLVVQVNNLQKAEGEKVYQVWLLNNGVRKNAGIFKPNNYGSGILTFELQENETFDNIGITLEPDQNSVQPRGEKIVGT